MVQEKRLSAFQVLQARKGNIELNPEAVQAAAQKIKAVQNDVKLSKQIKEASDSYEHNRRKRKEKQAKNKKARNQAQKQAEAEKKSSSAQPAAKKLKIDLRSPQHENNHPNTEAVASQKKQKQIATPHGNAKQTAKNSHPANSNKKASRKVEVQEWTPPSSSGFFNGKTTKSLAPVESSMERGKNISEVLEAPSISKKRKRRRGKDRKSAAPETQPEVEESEDVITLGKFSDEESDNSDQERTDEFGNDDMPIVSEENEDSEGDDSITLEHEDNEQLAAELFAKLLAPMKPTTFFTKYWTKKPLHIPRKDDEYYKEDDWFSTDELDRILREERIRFGVNLDLTTYKDGKRSTLNPAGRAYPTVVWDHYEQGCSVRLLNPQTYCERTWFLLSTLQEMFGCMVGANIYLTPPGTQGFAPHYDDIEGFVLQLEGKKHWKVYPPRTPADVWPLYSSPNLTQEELSEPIIDCILEPGDLLYFPRGAIHQALAQDDMHSLHITVSTHQKNSWADLLSLMVPATLNSAMQENSEFRESLPNDYLNYTGIAFQEQDGPRRQAFLAKAQSLMAKLIDYAPVDGACDLMAKKFIHDSLPPCLSMTDHILTANDQGEIWSEGKVRNRVELNPDVRVKLVRKHCVRIVNEQLPEEESQSSNSQNPVMPDATDRSMRAIDGEGSVDEGSDDDTEENVIRIYYNTDNDRLYHGNEIQFMEVDPVMAGVVEYLQLAYPKFTKIDDLPMDEVSDKMDIAMQLYDKGLIMTEEPLESLSSDDEDYCDEEEFEEEESGDENVN